MRATVAPPSPDFSHSGKHDSFPSSLDHSSAAVSSATIPLRAGPAPVAGPPDLSRAGQDEPSGYPREFAYRLGGLLMLGDWLTAIAAITVGLTLRELHRAGLQRFFESRPRLELSLAIWSVGGGLLFVWLMMMMRTYEVANLYRMQRSAKNLIKSIFLWAMALWSCVGIFDIEVFAPRLGIVYCMVLLGLFVGFWRLISFAFLIQPRVREAASSRIIVVGWNEKAAHLRRAMRHDLSQLGEIIGCVPLPGGHFAARPPADLAVLGDYTSIPNLVQECHANSVILADVSCSATEIRSLIAFCQREMLHFTMVPQYFPALNSGLQIQTLSGVPLLGVSQLPLDRVGNRLIKRTIDIVGALIGLALSSFIVPFFCLAVYLESPGPVIFRQRRTSRSGRDFDIFKIRSMRLNAEMGTGAVWCKQEDSRRLKIGAFMRKTNIDELPQFFNVLRGDMSLVGPRPERPELIEKFKDQIPNYNARHEVRAGLTGWAQINGLRGDTDLTKRIEADLYYLENWSVMLDLYCIFATLFRTKNAY